MGKLDLYLIRHGECRANTVPGYVHGRSAESPLTLKGNQQAELLGKRLKKEGVRFDEVYSSPIPRAHDTAKIACAHIDYSIDDILVRDELKELSPGDWEGQPRDKVYTRDILKELNSNNWEYRPPNGESQKDVEERMLKVIGEIIPKYKQGKKIGIFSHGMAIKCCLRGILGFDAAHTYKIDLDNTGITRLKYGERGWYLVTHNDAAHIKNDK